MRKSVLAVVAAVSMISVSSGAAAQSAAPLSLAHAPGFQAAGQDASDIRGGFILPTLAILAIIGAIYLLTRNNSPSSP
jgi:hypothetical protein